MVRTIAEYAVLPLLAASCLAQNSSGVYELPMTCTKTDQNGRTITGPCKEFMRETQEKYCRENPKDARCSGKPIDFKPYHLPPSGSAPRRTSRPSASPMSAVPIGQVALHDWRFAHSSPALLLSVNIGSLLKSPLWGTLLPVSAPDLERARAALSGIGQILLSLAPNGTGTPEMLALAKGEVDGAAGSWLRSIEGMQVKRLDAVTMLLGNPLSMKFADLRMRGPSTWSSSDPLLNSATESLKYDAWIGLDPARLGSVAMAFGSRSVANTAMRSLRGVSVGLYLRDQIRVEAAVDAPSLDIAERLLEAYQAQARGKEQAWVSVEGSRLKIIEIVSAGDLVKVVDLDSATKQTIAQYFTRFTQSLAQRDSAQPSSAAPRPAQAAIIIQGLDGTKQLPLK